MGCSVLDALQMDKMMSDIDSWKRDPECFLKERNLRPTQTSSSNKVFVLIVEGFLVLNYRYRSKSSDDTLKKKDYV